MDDLLPGISSGSAGGSVGGVLESLLSGGDAETRLVEGLIDHHLVMSQAGIRAATFLQVYGCGEELEFILRMRRYQQRAGQLVKALDAVSLKRFMGRLDVQLSNK